MREEVVCTFTGVDTMGTVHTLRATRLVLESHEAFDAGNPSTDPADFRYRIADGRLAKRLGKGLYQLDGGGGTIQSADPSAP